MVLKICLRTSRQKEKPPALPSASICFLLAEMSSLLIIRKAPGSGAFRKQCAQMQKRHSIAKLVPVELGRNVLKLCKLLLEKLKPNVKF